MICLMERQFGIILKMGLYINDIRIRRLGRIMVHIRPDTLKMVRELFATEYHVWTNENFDNKLSFTAEDICNMAELAYKKGTEVLPDRIKERHENMDSSSGDIYPVNAKIQGETFENISNFIRPRMRQLIKQVSYTMEVEYHPEEKENE